MSATIQGLSWRRVLGGLRRTIGILFWAAILVELASLFVLSLSNLALTGKMRDRVAPYRYSPYCVYHHQRGPRPTTVPQRRTSGERVVWMFGGSTMRGEPRDDSLTIPSLASSLLNDRGSGPGVALRNFGENAFNAILEAGYHAELMITGSERPDLVLFYDGANDVTFFCMQRRSDAHYAYDRMGAVIESNPPGLFQILKPLKAAWLASLSRELLSKLSYVSSELRDDDPELAAFVAESERRYDYLQAVTQAHGSVFVLVWQPFLWVQTECAPGDARTWATVQRPFSATIRNNSRKVNRALVERLKGKPYFVNLQDVLARAPSSVPLYAADGVHVTDAGRRIVAERIAAVLASRLPPVEPVVGKPVAQAR